MSTTIIDDQLATIPGIQAYLQNYVMFAAHYVEKLIGGLGNFTYRLHLVTAFAGRETLVLKYTPPYGASSGGSFPLDQKRQFVEVQALRLASQLRNTNIPEFITVPVVHLFDEENHVIIMDDAGQDSRTLKQLLIDESLPKNVAAEIGSALGEFISNVHNWNQDPSVDLSIFANYQLGKFITVYITYGLLESTLLGRDNIPTLSNPLLGIPEAKMTTISKVAEKRRNAIHAASGSDPVTHGDFWPGNLIVSLRRGADGTIEGVEKMYVVDWEVCKNGLPGLDVGQLCAELYTLSEFYPARVESTRTMINSFLGTYRERRGTAGDVELARTVLSHVGAHLVGVTPRVKPWTGRQKTREVVEKGVEMLVLGEEGSEFSLKTSIVGPLL